MFYRLVSIYTLLYTLVSFIIGYPIGLIIWLFTIPFDRKLKILHQYTSVWGISFLKINPFIKITIQGKEHIRNDKTYVMICNHQSLLDIVVLYGLFAHFKWVAKKELFNVPVVGWVMRLNGYVAVDRGNRQTHAQMFKECEKNLERGNSIMIFPEGTRSEDKEIHNFKEGAFKIALASGKPILPIILDGTADAIPKKGLFFRKLSKITITIFPPIPFESFKTKTSKELSVQFHDFMVGKLKQLREK